MHGDRCIGTTYNPTLLTGHWAWEVFVVNGVSLQGSISTPLVAVAKYPTQATYRGKDV